MSSSITEKVIGVIEFHNPFSPHVCISYYLLTSEKVGWFVKYIPHVKLVSEIFISLPNHYFQCHNTRSEVKRRLVHHGLSCTTLKLHIINHQTVFN